jgi:hypothetical protein
MKKNILILLSLVAFGGTVSAMHKLSIADLQAKFDACVKKHDENLHSEDERCDSLRYTHGRDKIGVSTCKNNARYLLSQQWSLINGCANIKEELVKRTENEREIEDKEFKKCRSANPKIFERIDNLCSPLKDNGERADCFAWAFILKDDLCEALNECNASQKQNNDK